MISRSCQKGETYDRKSFTARLGTYCFWYGNCFCIPGDADIRSNMTAGAIAVPAKVTDSMLQLAELVRPRLQQDGIFFAGMDIVGDKVMEINVQSPGGIQNAEKFEEAPFTSEIIKSVERKVAHRMQHPESISNIELAIF